MKRIKNYKKERKRMDNFKKVIPGQTVYLKPGEEFNVVKSLAEQEADMLKNMPAAIPVVLNSSGEVVRLDDYSPITKFKEEEKKIDKEETPLVVKEPKEETKEELSNKTSINFAKRILQKAKEEKTLIGPIPIDIDSYSLQQQDDEEDDVKEIFSNIVVDKEEVQEIEKPKSKAKIVDLNRIKIVNKNELEKERDLRTALYGNKAAFQIVAAQSGYMAKVLPLVHKDIMDILRENLNAYERQKSLFFTIWEKIYETSVGKMTFENWLKNTSVEDMETFYYGIYAATFPNEGSFRLSCLACDAEKDYKVNHGNLIKTTDNEYMKKIIDIISKEANSVEKMKEFSLIDKNLAIQLSETGIIIELKTPSLMDLLETLKTVPEKILDKDTQNIVYMLYINKLLIPSKEKSTYIEEYKKTNILRIIDNLPIDDANEFKNAIDEKIEENRITYSIKNIECPDCGHKMKDIPVSIENILFTLIFEKAQH